MVRKMRQEIRRVLPAGMARKRSRFSLRRAGRRALSWTGGLQMGCRQEASVFCHFLLAASPAFLTFQVSQNGMGLVEGEMQVFPQTP